ncbi:hypothetical protein R1flu_001475 [Riccia fluitans]|uniref:RNase H type-1 domain-containing protein n=1 Tax=Riccia fluitans TaxID=41844 RepID=A0ABD1Y3D2_9MARC
MITTVLAAPWSETPHIRTFVAPLKEQAISGHDEMWKTDRIFVYTDGSPLGARDGGAVVVMYNKVAMHRFSFGLEHYFGHNDVMGNEVLNKLAKDETLLTMVPDSQVLTLRWASKVCVFCNGMSPLLRRLCWRHGNNL